MALIRHMTRTTAYASLQSNILPRQASRQPPLPTNAGRNEITPPVIVPVDNNTPQVETVLKGDDPPQSEAYDPMADAPDP